jgi:NAD(P)-dependent dehydrogenase (short-subunit alcohol dehydrogenase family)
MPKVPPSPSQALAPNASTSLRRRLAWSCSLRSRDRAAVAKLAERLKALGQVDILVNNAGITHDKL